MFYQIFLSPQVERWTIITYTQCIRVALLIAERLKTWDLTKLGNIRKVSRPQRMIAQRQCPRANENFFNTGKKFPKIAIKTLPQCAALHENQSWSQISCD